MFLFSQETENMVKTIKNKKSKTPTILILNLSDLNYSANSSSLAHFFPLLFSYFQKFLSNHLIQNLDNNFTF